MNNTEVLDTIEICRKISLFEKFRRGNVSVIIVIFVSEQRNDYKKLIRKYSNQYSENGCEDKEPPTDNCVGASGE